MDPRHPEQAISRMRELMKQYDRIETDMAKATTSAQLAQLEREGGLVIQEICLVAPRIHEAMMQTSRQRRHDLSRGILVEPQDAVVEIASEGVLEVINMAKKNAVKKSEMEYHPEQGGGTVTLEWKPVEKSTQSVTKQSTEPTQSVKKIEVKPKKKTTRKKKTTKEAEK